jgi:SNF2 family DNA or RNA helicase
MSVITRLQERCVQCNAVAREKSSRIIEGKVTDTKLIKLECGHVIVKELPKGTPFESLVSNWWKKDQTCTHIWDPDDYKKCLLCNETRLYEFQVEGARFLESAFASGRGGAVFDEMGLGKTVQSLAYLRFHPEAFPVLFVVKSGIKYQWRKEIFKWLGPEYIAQVIDSSNTFVIPKMHCYVVSYDIFTEKQRKMKSGKIAKQGKDIKEFDFIKTVLMDECQQIKNSESKRTGKIRQLVKDKQVLPLSGTPWKNHGAEYYPVLNMLDPMKFSNEQNFLNRWVEVSYDGKLGGIKNINAFRDYTKDILIRREVEEVNIQMPSVSRAPHYIELDKASTIAYDKAENDFVKWMNDLIVGGDEPNGMQIQGELMRMRHIIGLAKIDGTVEKAQEHYENTDRKLVVFVHHIDVGQLLHDKFKEEFKDIDIFQLTGSQTGPERFAIAEKFQASKRAFMVASTLSAGEGINLQTCGDAYLHERQWNPQNEDQAAPGRFRRIGAAHNKINVTFMTAAGTTDDILADIVERKRGAFHSSMNKGEAVQWDEGNILKELAYEILARHREKNKKFALSRG